MIDSLRQNPSQHTVPNSGQAGSTAREARSIAGILALAAVVGMFILLPVQFVELPLNLMPVDVWNVFALPVIWMYLARKRDPLRAPYIAAMWLIALGSFIGMFMARDIVASLIVLCKEVYLYVWFLTIALLLAHMEQDGLRLVFLTWGVAALVHGVLIIVQFLSPEAWRAMLLATVRYGSIDVDRPAGLFNNANGAAIYQLMGYVPILLLGWSRPACLTLGLLLLLSIVGTGSLGAVLGGSIGLLVAFAAGAAVERKAGYLLRTLASLVVAAAILVGLGYMVVGLSPDLQGRVEMLFYGRAEGSAAGRFSLWEAGIQALGAELPLWGIGPDNFRDPVTRKTLHNDLLAFMLERGVIGTLGLVLFGALAVLRAGGLLVTHKRLHGSVAPTIVVFLAVVTAGLVESQFHQVFHERAFWLVLAVQEATRSRLAASDVRGV